jgi:hypothetical protein
VALSEALASGLLSFRPRCIAAGYIFMAAAAGPGAEGHASDLKGRGRAGWGLENWASRTGPGAAGVRSCVVPVNLAILRVKSGPDRGEGCGRDAITVTARRAVADRYAAR